MKNLLIESQHCAQCNSRETSSLGVVPNDGGSTHRRCFCPWNIQTCCRPFEYASMWQIQAIGAVYNIRSKIKSFQLLLLSWNDIRCKTLCVYVFNRDLKMKIDFLKKLLSFVNFGFYNPFQNGKKRFDGALSHEKSREDVTSFSAWLVSLENFYGLLFMTNVKNSCL